MITQRQTDIDKETFSISVPETASWTNILPDYVNVQWGAREQSKEQQPQTAGMQTNTLLIIAAIGVIGVMFMMKK